MKTSTYNSTLHATTLLPAAVTATAQGTTVDRAASLANFRSAALVVHVGTVTDGTHVFTLQESDNDSDWTTVAAANLQGSAISVTSANDERVFELGYTGSARYLRGVVTVSGSPATGGVYGAVIALSGSRRTPVAR